MRYRTRKRKDSIMFEPAFHTGLDHLQTVAAKRYAEWAGLRLDEDGGIADDDRDANDATAAQFEADATTEVLQ
jgi:hypothetical protein